MSTEFKVHRKYLICDIPEALEYQSEGDYFIIGTRFGNGSVEKHKAFKEEGEYSVSKLGYYPKGVTDESPFARVLFISDYLMRLFGQTDSPYYSQWSPDSPVYFYDTPCRWCWHTLGWRFWSKAMPRKARVINNNGDKDIKTWGQLYDAIYGMDAHMQDRGEGGGTYMV